MDMLFLVGAMSVIIWYIIDRLKELWVNVPYSKYITVGISAILSFACAFCFSLDILVGLGLIAEVSIMGQILTALVFMGGSSAVSELIGLVKNATDVIRIKNENMTVEYTIPETTTVATPTTTTVEAIQLPQTEEIVDESNVIIEESTTVG